MVQQLTKTDREAHREEQPGEPGMRVSIAIDAENQPRPWDNERVIRWRANEALHLAADRLLEAEVTV